MNNIFTKLLLSSVLGIGVISTASADSLIGVINGADCYLHSKNCVTSSTDPHLVLVNDFILVTDNGYYFLPNMPREVKIGLLNATVKITGDVMNYEVDVSEAFIKHGSIFNSVWDGEQLSYDEYTS